MRSARRCYGIAQAALRRASEAEPQLIKALVASTDCVAQASQHGLRREPGVSLARVHQVEPSSTVDAAAEGGNAFFNPVLRPRDQLSGSRRRSSAQVSDKVRNGEVSLMADGRYHRKLGVRNNASERLVVESGEVFQ